MNIFSQCTCQHVIYCERISVRVTFIIQKNAPGVNPIKLFWHKLHQNYRIDPRLEFTITSLNVKFYSNCVDISRIRLGEIALIVLQDQLKISCVSKTNSPHLESALKRFISSSFFSIYLITNYKVTVQVLKRLSTIRQD